MPCRYKRHCHLHRLKWVKTTQPDTAACLSKGQALSEGLGPAGWLERSSSGFLTWQHVAAVRNAMLRDVISLTLWSVPIK